MNTLRSTSESTGLLTAAERPRRGGLLGWGLLVSLALAGPAVAAGPVVPVVPDPAGQPKAAGQPQPAAVADARDVVVRDLGDRPVTLRGYAGKVVVLVHEDKDASRQNRAFKDALGALVPAHRGRLVVVALADVSRYDYWPARGFVVRALNKLPRDADSVVWADWKGALRQKLGLRRAESSVLVLGSDGRPALLQRGDLSAAQTAAALATIRAALASDTGAP